MATDFLSRIVEAQREKVQRAQRAVPERTLRDRAGSTRDHRPFHERLVRPGPCGVNIIAEIKRASPSKGLIREDLDPAELARSYERGGACAVSVLTERAHFRGSLEDLREARAAVTLPVLSKDFVIAPYQIYEAAGADAVLLIVRILRKEELRDLVALCQELGLDPLVEVHSEAEWETATWAGARLIGINNRDLDSFTTNLHHCVRISQYLEPHQTAVAESGIRGREDVEMLLEAGLWNFLVGESLVKAPDPEVFLHHLLGVGGK